MFSSDLTDYVIRQLGRTKNKRYEAYVVSRIIHLLNDDLLMELSVEPSLEHHALQSVWHKQKCLYP